jgi:hypothetical protein
VAIDRPVVDRPGQIVGQAGGLEVELELDVHLEALLGRLLVGVDPVASEEGHSS